MPSPWRFSWFSLTRSPSPERRSHPEKNGGTRDRDNFKTKIRSVTNKQKMRRGRKWRVWLCVCLGGGGGVKSDGRKQQKRRAGMGEGCINKQTAQSQPRACVQADLGGSWMDKVKLRSPLTPCTLCLGRSLGSPGSKPPDACDEASWQLG